MTTLPPLVVVTVSLILKLLPVRLIPAAPLVLIGPSKVVVPVPLVCAMEAADTAAVKVTILALPMDNAPKRVVPPTI